MQQELQFFFSPSASNKTTIWRKLQAVGGAPALVMDGWMDGSFRARFASDRLGRGAVMEERGERLMIALVGIYIAALAALTHTHSGPNHLFRVINISWGFVGRKHGGCFMQNICKKRFPAGSRRFVATDGGGRLALMQGARWWRRRGRVHRHRRHSRGPASPSLLDILMQTKLNFNPKFLTGIPLPLPRLRPISRLESEGGVFSPFHSLN